MVSRRAVRCKRKLCMLEKYDQQDQTELRCRRARKKRDNKERTTNVGRTEK